MDFAGPFEGKMLLIVVDAYSKWLEVHICSSATAATVIDALRSMFATFGIPKVVCSDNGTPFLAKDTNQFLQANNIRHITSAPYHPATNGQAERMVRETKESLRKLSEGSLNCRLARFLFKHHTTVSSTTGKTPAELMFGRQLLCPLDNIHPRGKEGEEGFKDAKFSNSQAVFIKGFAGQPKWIEAKVLRQVGSRSFEVTTSDGRIQRRHIDDMRSRLTQHSEPGSSTSSRISSYPAFDSDPDEQKDVCASGQASLETESSTANTSGAFSLPEPTPIIRGQGSAMPTTEQTSESSPEPSSSSVPVPLPRTRPKRVTNKPVRFRETD